MKLLEDDLPKNIFYLINWIQNNKNKFKYEINLLEHI